jgi:antitoxin (DNA-binding transcriptional repressor) of toxin-antitoxin stability system
MKVISLDGANLETCVHDAQQGRVVLTRKGKPVALVVGVAGLDLEQIELGHSDELWAMLRQRRNQKTMTRKELEERLVERNPVIKADGRK